jgi:hypothetical protein
MTNNHFILLTIDVEDWFQVENFKPWIPFSSWSSRELRVEKNTRRLLDLLDSTSCGQSVIQNEQPATSNQQPVSKTTNSSNPINSPKATFFVLGWVAERLPHLVREIHTRGHELQNASHTSSEKSILAVTRWPPTAITTIFATSAHPKI